MLTESCWQWYNSGLQQLVAFVIKSSFSAATTSSSTTLASLHWTMIIDGFASPRCCSGCCAICRYAIALAAQSAKPHYSRPGSQTIRHLDSQWADLPPTGHCAVKCQLVAINVQVLTNPQSIFYSDAAAVPGGRVSEPVGLVMRRNALSASAYLRRNPIAD